MWRWPAQPWPSGGVPRPDRPELLVAAAALSVLLAGVVTVTGQAAPPAPQPVAISPTSGTATAVAPAGLPVGLDIPSLDVDRTLIPLGRQPDGALDVPSDYDDVGIWSDRDDDAPVVLAGHVDSTTGPAVFFRLAELAPGDDVVVLMDDGRRVRHVVERVEQHPKDAFPTFEVFGADGEGALRLVTCGGAFDRDERSYDDNVVVFARAVPT